MRLFLFVAGIATAILLTFQNCSPVGPADSNSKFSVPIRNWVGPKQFGMSGIQTKANHLSLDPLGAVYVVGNTNGRLDPTAMISTGAFIAKYDRTGEKAWIRQIGVDQFTTEGIGIASDASNVYIVGWTNTGLNTSLQGNIDVFLAKYGASGDRKWIKQYGTVGATAEGLKVVVDAQSNIVVVGFVTGQLDGAIAVGDQDLFIMKFDSSGNRKFVKQYGVAGKVTSANAVATDFSSNIYLTGYTTGAYDGNGALGVPDAIVAKFDVNGNKVWSKQLGSAAAQSSGTAIALDQGGSVYVSGTTTGAIDGNSKVGLVDTFLAKYQPDGTKVFVKQTGFAGTTAQSFAIAVDRLFNVYLAGNNLGDPATTFNVGYLMKYDPLGARIWTKQYSVPGGHVLGTGVAVDTAYNVFFGGQTDNGIEGNQALGATDSFILKFNAQGVRQ